MIVLITKGFTKSYNKLPVNIQTEIDLFYTELLNTVDLRGVRNTKKMKGYKVYYRYKIGDYRVGFKLENNTITLLIALHRKEIYKYFP